MISTILIFKVSGIGVLPILLVVLSAIFLWGMVVYNSLKTRRNNTNIYLQTVGKLALQRVQLLTQLGQLLNMNLLADDEGYDEAKLAAETQWMESKIADLNMQEAPEVKKLQAELAQNASLLVQAQRKFRFSRKNYNELCEQMPYRLIATLFSYKPLAV